MELKILWQKGEIAHHEQFLCLQNSFQKSSAVKVCTCWKALYNYNQIPDTCIILSVSSVLKTAEENQ